MSLAKVTPLILTYNEAANIQRTCERLAWAKQILVVDSGSTDDTLIILSNYLNIRVIHRSFDTHAKQWNFALKEAKSEWVLSLDADYQITNELLQEIAKNLEDPQVDGYYIPFRYCVFGKPLRGSILPPRLALFKKNSGHYIDDGHTQILQFEGRMGSCRNPILHDDRKPLSRWLWAQDRYIQLEVQKLLKTPDHELSLGDRIRKLKLIAPFVVLFYCLILKGGILEGWRGWFYAFQRLYAELLLSLRLLESDLQTPTLKQ